MKNITLSMNESLVERARAHARARGTTLNQLIRDLVSREVEDVKAPSAAEFFRLADEMGLKSDGPYLTREEANERW